MVNQVEWGIHINQLDEIGSASLKPESIHPSAGKKLNPIVDLTLKLINEYFDDPSFSRWVYGNEFCEHLIPSVNRFQRVVEESIEYGVPLTFLTPYVSDTGIEALRRLFERLSSTKGGSEVVFNDWGVLNLIHNEFPDLVPVQGRLLNKSLRDPRVTGVYSSSQAPEPALVTLKRSNLDCTSYTRFLSDFGVDNVELDNLHQGIDFGFIEDGLNATVYVPFGFISTSRICMAAGIHYQKIEKFQPGAPCHHECQTHLLEYSYTNAPFGNRDQKFYLKGNTYFYTHTEMMLRNLFEQARAGFVERLVFQPSLPMMWERN